MKLLVVIDVQNGFTRTDKTKEVSRKIVELTNSGEFDIILASKFINNDESPYVSFLKWNKLMKSPETDLVDGLKFDFSFEKSTYTCWSDNFLSMLVKANNGKVPHEVYICGIDTDCCVLNTAVDLFEHKIKPIVLTNYCYSNGGEEYHLSALKVLERNIGKDSLSKEK
ncbi:MAG: isochorismatase family cysteine hydrolase [Sphaerochaetaceae bacterium]|nr:isochorismatase family cysteine hydrolase [Sphaerochaetaceae bacterium]